MTAGPPVTGVGGSDEASDQAELPPFLSDATLFDIAGEAVSCMSAIHSFSLFCVSQEQLLLLYYYSYYIL